MTPAGTGGRAGRVDLSLPGRILIAAEGEQACLLVSLEGRTTHLRTGSTGVDGRPSTAVTYLDIIGRIEGATVRVGPDRVLLTIEALEAKWARLRLQLARVAGMSDAEREDLRGHGRVAPDVPTVRVTLPHGMVVAGRIRDLSRSGAAVEALAAVEVADRVLLGATCGRVVWVFDGGFAVQFARLLPLELFGPSFEP